MSAVAAGQPTGFQHEVLTYEGAPEFTRRLTPFIEEGLDHGEAMLVVVTSDKIERLRAALGAGASQMHFAPMEQVGRNPARIIPAWREFLDSHLGSGRGVRGIGEPIFSGRDEAELDECHRHEALLNTAFDGSGQWRLLCPYDVTAFDPEVVKRAHENHPLVNDVHRRHASGDFRHLASPFEGALPEPPEDHVAVPFGIGPLGQIRAVVAAHAIDAGMEDEHVADLLLAVNELATNSLRHGGGEGVLRLWPEPGALVCQVSDRGRMTDPLLGRRRPPADLSGGRGLWLANQLCDLVQIRSSERGTTICVRMSLA